MILLEEEKTSAQAVFTDSISLNGDWKFKTDIYKKGMEEQWFLPTTKTDHWDNMQVPGSWDTHNEYAHYTGDAWYKTTFTLSKEASTKQIRLIFESVYNYAEVWLNGNKIGDNNLGYLAFQFNINKYLQFGAANTLVLKVNNGVKLGATWNWGGIRQPVWLAINQPSYIQYTAINAIPNLQNGTASIDMYTEFAGLNKTSTYSFDVSILYQGKKLINSSKQSINTSQTTETIATTKLQLTKDQVNLWHFEQPLLYEALITLYQNGKAVHSFKEQFGIRKIEVDGFKLKLNGEEIKTVGFNIIPEDRVYGNAMPLERFKQMVDLMKECGANMARLSHFALPKSYLDYLDAKGMMIFEEVSLWGKDTLVDPAHPLPKLWLKKLVKQQYNHPSVIGWSVGNEIGSFKNNPLVYEYVKQAIALAKQLDPNRLASYASNTATNQPNDPAELCDIIMMNSYGNWGKAAEMVHKNFPSKLIFFSEFGADLNDENLDKSTIPLDKMMTAMRNKPYVVGASLWTLNDYRSNYWNIKSTWNTAPSENRAWGIVNSVMQPKKSFYPLKKEYQPFTIKNTSFSLNNNLATVSFDLQSRNFQSFPAYTIKDYQLKIEAKDAESKILFSKVQSIPQQTPGNDAIKLSIQVNTSNSVNSISYSIIDRLGYNRYDSSINLQKPAEPIISAIHKDLNSFRVVFNKREPNTKYYVKYGTKAFTKTSDTAILNHYLDIENLHVDSTYQIQLVAQNNVGSSVSSTQSIQLISTELPPIVWAVIPKQKAFFISFSTDPLDYKYEVEYGEKAGQYYKRIILGNPGGIEIPNLKSKATYFVRMRRMLQWGFASDWTSEYSVTTK
ncbi:MAG: glycoside hydrolase family 2 protein [Chitinophagaceae bacterium]